MRFLKDYLYWQDCDFLDYVAGFEYFKKFKMGIGACSVIRDGYTIGRNLDWYYDEHVDVIVRTKNYDGRYATIGVAHTGGKLTNSFIKNGLATIEDLAPIPFLMSDCLNEKGVYCSTNVVPLGDKDNTKIVGTMGPEVCQLMLPRYVCDYAASVEEAIDILEHSRIYAPLNNLEQDCHLFLADSTKTCVVEFIDGELSIIEDVPILTNFHLTGWNRTIASVALGDNEEEVRLTGLTDHAMGLERYAILETALYSELDMWTILESIAYTKAYSETENPIWYSEFYGETETFGDLTIYNTAEEMAGILQYAREHRGSRDGSSWNTTHSCVYNLNDLTLQVVSQEDFDEVFNVEMDLSAPYGIIGIGNLYGEFRKI